MFKYIKKISSLKIQNFFLMGNFPPLHSPELEHSERQNSVEIKKTKEKKAKMLSYHYMRKLSLYCSWCKIKIHN